MPAFEETQHVFAKRLASWARRLLPTPTSGELEALKWIALATMLIDHVNVAFYARGLDWAAAPGRLAMPLFSLVLGFNLARSDAGLPKMLLRLILFGLVATPFHTMLFSSTFGWWPLNILFTFACSVAVIEAIRRQWWAAAATTFVLGGIFVDYVWVGVAFPIAAWWYYRHRGTGGALAIAACLIALCVYSELPYALLSLPLVWLVHAAAPAVPRLRWMFWVAYPLHLAILWCLRLSFPSLSAS